MPTSTLKRRTPSEARPQWDAAKVKALRFYMGLTQQVFARRLGVHQQRVSEWEKGIYRPRGATVTRLTMFAEQVGFTYEGESPKK